jgi:hypothetical protein
VYISELKGSNDSRALRIAKALLGLCIAAKNCAFLNFKVDEVGCCSKEKSIAFLALLVSLLSK